MELSDFASVALYLAVFLTAIALAYIGQKKNNKTLCVLAILLPVIIAGFRYSAGTDSITYRNFYTEVGNEDISKTVDRLNSGGLEPFLILFSVVGNALHLPASFLFICFALITAVFLYATTRLFNKERAWLYYGMLLLIVFPESLNMMRQVAAISVQAYALVSIFKAKRNNVRTHWSGMIALAALSVCLHYSSVLLLPVLLLPVITKHVSFKRLTAALGALLLCCLFAFPYILDFVVKAGVLSERHLSTFMSIEGSLVNVKFFAAIILSAILIASYHRRKELVDKQLGALMLTGAVYSSVGFYSGYLGRLAMLFWVFIIIIFGDILCQLFEKKSHRIISCMAVAIAYFVLYFGILGFNEIVPYSFGF